MRELKEDEMKVKFIGFKYDSPIYAHGEFTIGKDYSVIREDNDGTYLLLEDRGFELWENVSNFSKVEEKTFPTPMSVNYVNPDTVVVWDDGDVTRVKCKEGEKWDEYIGFLACLAKKVYGGHNQYKKFIKNAVQNE